MDKRAPSTRATLGGNDPDARAHAPASTIITYIYKCARADPHPHCVTARRHQWRHPVCDKIRVRGWRLAPSPTLAKNLFPHTSLTFDRARARTHTHKTRVSVSRGGESSRRHTTTYNIQYSWHQESSLSATTTTRTQTQRNISIYMCIII